MRWPRPALPTAGAVVISAMAGVLFVIARATGSGWLVVVLSGLLATLAVALVLPAIDLARLKVAIEAAPDAVAGRPAAVTIRIDRARRPLQVRLVDPASVWAAVDPPAAGPVNAVPARRGVIAEVGAEARSSAPLGLFRWRRPLRLVPRRPIEVAPCPLAVTLPAVHDQRSADQPAGGSVVTGGDMARGVREYVAGDPQRLISWSATARHRQLMVKELETPAPRRLVLAASLGDGSSDQEAVERAAARAAGMATAALAAGMPVVLCTAEPSGAQTASVTSVLDAGRRLARAVPGPVAVPPPAPGDMTVRVIPE